MTNIPDQILARYRPLPGTSEIGVSYDTNIPVQFLDRIEAVIKAVASEPIGYHEMTGYFCVFCEALSVRHTPSCIVLVARQLCDELGWEVGEANLSQAS